MNTNLKTSLIAIGQLITIVALLFGGECLGVWLYSVDPKLLRIVGGILLWGLGLIILFYGDKILKVKGGIILKAFDASNYPARLIKWVVGLILILVGGSFIFNKF